MRSDWQTKRLGEVAENISRPFDFKNKTKVIFINTGDVLEGKLLHQTYTNVNKLPGQAKKAIKKGDILYSEIRPGNKRYLLVDFECEDFVVSTKFMVIRPIGITSEFLYLKLISNEVEDEFKMVADSRSGTFPQITFESIAYYPIKYPINKIQKAIAKLGFDFIYKIANNNRINQTLEQIAQALFKSWFVDFDPVKAKIQAKAQGKDPQLAAMEAISGKTAVETQGFASPEYDELRATADLFPDQLVESELGLMPEGWILKPLYETAEYVNGGAFKSKDFSESKEGLPIIKIAELKSGISAQTKYTSKEMPEKYRINNDDMLYSWSGSPETSLEVFKWYGGQGWLNQHIFKINTENIEQKVFVYYLLKFLKPQLIQIAKNKQTTGLGHVTVADMKRMQVVMPNDSSYQLITDNFISLFEQASNCMKQNSVLSLQRDTLLPKLLSGAITTNL
ncbi:restriction endonuclease subunit S [Marinifilum sp. D714]|uniref:restriction endonuclease subunit S n=1 Tax=Marinifilum sp. D714 TaxID=2937523 RepID=UPI0027C7AA96|nr:restriction endonuclease subunit S [Marinifilum sp. D714]MDQ2178790.1 restriction endonuclease subunit S [Marinifilum sp. D714]